jgi:hypothetical protein
MILVRGRRLHDIREQSMALHLDKLGFRVFENTNNGCESRSPMMPTG